MCTYTYIYIYICMYVCVYIYIYIHMYNAQTRLVKLGGGDGRWSRVKLQTKYSTPVGRKCI